MKSRHRERLKDVIIDHVYNQCYSEVVRVVENEPGTQTSHTEEDPYMQKIYDTFIKPSGSVRMFHELRNAIHCRLTDDGKVSESLSSTLRQRGFRENGPIYEDVCQALDYLVGRSYLVRNLPVKDEYTLTPKGHNHYSSGRSFEDEWLAAAGNRRALMLSWISISIVLASLAAAFVYFI